MKIQKMQKEAFTVIGKEGSTAEGDGFIQRLWQDANTHFGQIADLAKKDKDGNLVGIWGAMSDLSRYFLPWEDFKHGLYLAGAECRDGCEAPEGWVKWVIPAYEFLVAEHESDQTFPDMLAWMREHDLQLAGAVNDYSDPRTGKNYMYFPIRRL